MRFSPRRRAGPSRAGCVQGERTRFALCRQGMRYTSGRSLPRMRGMFALPSQEDAASNVVGGVPRDFDPTTTDGPPYFVFEGAGISLLAG